MAVCRHILLCVSTSFNFQRRQLVAFIMANLFPMANAPTPDLESMPRRVETYNLPVQHTASTEMHADKARKTSP